MIVDLTAEQLRDACETLYRPNGFRDAPAQLFLDHFAEADPPTTYLRASFRRMTDRGMRMLSRLEELLHERHGEGSVVFCVYFSRLEALDLARHSITMSDR